MLVVASIIRIDLLSKERAVVCEIQMDGNKDSVRACVRESTHLA